MTLRSVVNINQKNADLITRGIEDFNYRSSSKQHIDLTPYAPSILS
jgi:hypothetical protein